MQQVVAGQSVHPNHLHHQSECWRLQVSAAEVVAGSGIEADAS